MNVKIVNESLDDFFKNSNEKIKQLILNNYNKLNNFLRKKNFNKLAFRMGNYKVLIDAQLEFEKLINSILGTNKLEKKDLEFLNNNQLLKLNNGLLNIINSYNLKESYEPKDLKRIKDFSNKSKGDYDKEVMLAKQMANTLTNIDKAVGRAEAALDVYGESNEIVDIFFNKAKKLGYKGPHPAEKLKQEFILGSKLPKDRQINLNLPKNSKRKTMSSSYGFFILPLGRINLRNGESDVFNVYNEWDLDNTTVEVWRDNKGYHYTHLLNKDVIKTPESGIASLLKPKSKEELQSTMRKYFDYKLVFTQNNKPFNNIGDVESFYHDQNKNFIGRWEMVDFVLLKNMKELIFPYGNNLFGYTYK